MARNSERAERARERSVQRAATSGAGPTRSPIAAFPGAHSWFGLFGEAMLTGILITVLAIPLVTLPAALAVGVRHLRRFLRGEGSGFRPLLADLRDALLGGLGLGVLSLVVAAAAIFAIAQAPDPTRIAGWVALVVLFTILLLLAGAWTPETRWRAALRGLSGQFDADPLGIACLAVVVGFGTYASWSAIPLVVPVLGMLAFAVIALPERPRRGTEEEQ